MKQILSVQWLFMVMVGILPAVLAPFASTAAEATLLNVSYDVTREFYQDFNSAFAAYWKQKSGDTVTVQQSHGSSSKQARSVIDGLEADVVTMNQPLDIDVLHTKAKLVPPDWAARLPKSSAPQPYYPPAPPGIRPGFTLLS